MNVQLGSKERVKVYLDPDSKRILGFGPEFMEPAFPHGTRYTETICYHASEIESYLNKYREQKKLDAEIQTYNQKVRENQFRAALKSAIRARNLHVNQFNRDLNNVLIELMDARYNARMKAQENPEIFGAAEAYEEKKDSMDVALENPLLNLRPENA